MILEETYTLSKGLEIPKLGLGTWFIDNANAASAVKEAVKMGYRHLDTAHAYGNEEGVGEGIRTCATALKPPGTMDSSACRVTVPVPPGGTYDDGVDIASLVPGRSPATAAAREVVAHYSSAALVNHCERSYLWSASLGHLSRIPYDAELLYVAAMLHDLGLVRAFDNHLAPFEDAGGDVGWVFGAGVGWTTERRDRVKEIIVRHMWKEVDPALDAEGHLLCEGTGLDISGRNVQTWPVDFRAEVLRRYPRLTLVSEFAAAFEDQARRKPNCAAAIALASGLWDRLASNPLD